MIDSDRRSTDVQQAMDELEYRRSHGIEWDRIEEPVYTRQLLDIEKFDRMPGVDGPQTGVKVRDAIRLSRIWWDGIGRRLVRYELGDLNPEQGGVPGGIVRGLPSDHLTREEAERVVYIWNEQICIPYMAGKDDQAAFVLDPVFKGGHTERVKRD